MFIIYVSYKYLYFLLSFSFIFYFLLVISAWLKNDDHAVVSKISRRVQDITGLTVGTAEELQVVNYGIGGHYEPHFDFARVSSQFLPFVTSYV